MLAQEVDDDQFDHNDLVPLELKAGQISMHDDGLIHGSLPNTSLAAPRIGLVKPPRQHALRAAVHLAAHGLSLTAHCLSSTAHCLVTSPRHHALRTAGPSVKLVPSLDLTCPVSLHQCLRSACARPFTAFRAAVSVPSLGLSSHFRRL